jgi:small-conductance mechanosensitive channel
MRKDFKELYFKPLFSILGKPILFLAITYIIAYTLPFITTYFTSIDTQLLLQTIASQILTIITGFFIYIVLTRLIVFFTPQLYTFTSIEKIIYSEYLNSIVNKDVKILIALIIIYIFSQSSFFSYDISTYVQNSTKVLIILTIAIMFARFVSGYFETFSRRHMPETMTNPLLRKTITQLHIVKNIVFLAIGIITISGICMLFDNIKQIGLSILASAGVLTIVLGIAARESFSGFFAAIRIAISQPFRINDLIVYENETGQVEEITFSHVVIKLWDFRRLIVPINQFTEKSFINLTKQSTELLGTAFLYVDYSIPVDPIRNEFIKLVNQSPLWDKHTATLQVSSLTERSVELRIVVSAADSSKLWDLRCWLREKLISFIHNEYPDAFPKFRGDYMIPIKREKDSD